MTLAPTMTDTPTRERIVGAAVELFARQGFKGTTVGEIEGTAGLAPRAGGFYKHFASKEAVLEAALAAHDREIDAVAASLAGQPFGDIRAQLTLTARLALMSLESERRLVMIIMKEGDRFPELRDAFYERFVERGLTLSEALLTRICRDAGVDPPPVRPRSTMLLAGLVGYRLQDFIFARRAGDVGEDDFIEAWVESALALLRSWGVDAPTTAGGA